MNTFFAITVAVVLLYIVYAIGTSNRKNSIEYKRKNIAKYFIDFLTIRQKEVCENDFSESSYNLEFEISSMLIEANELKLFSFEILKKFTPYTDLEMFLDIDKEIAKDEILELKSYFRKFL